MIYTVTMTDMEKAGITDVAANYKPSGKAPVERIYQGVLFETLLQSLGIDLGDGEAVLFTAADGYATGIPMEEAMDASKCVIAIGLEGEPLGSKADGGFGSYMMILPSDQFSQRWCKFLFEVSVQ